MEKLYVPYSGDKPLSVLIKGHKFVVLSPSREIFAHPDSSGAIGRFDVVKVLNVGGSQKDLEAALSKVAQSTGSGVLVVPRDSTVKQVFERLELELPWVH